MMIGLENKKQASILAGLVLLLGYLAYSNLFSSSGPAPENKTAAPAPPSEAALAAEAASIPTPAQAAAPVARGEDFHPVFRSKRPEQRIDPNTVDPALHLELLARLQDVSPESSGRNLFQFSTPPPPPAPPAALAKLTAPEPIVVVQPKPQTPGTESRAAAPPPPPIPLKCYALATARATGKKAAFFLDGDEILIGSEGDVLKKRYRVVRIGVNSVVMEDMDYKREQTLPLEDNASLP